MMKRVLTVASAALVVGGLSVASAYANAPATSQAEPTPMPPVAAPAYVIVPDPGTEENIPLELVPLGVRYTALQAALQYFDEPSFESAQFDTGGDMAAYELAGTTADGNTIEVDVYPDNTVEEVEVVIDEAEVPTAVADALKAYFPDNAVTEVERSYRPLKNGVTVTYYEFSLETDGDGDLDVDVREDGAQLTIERGSA